MGLNYDYTNCKDHNAVARTGTENDDGSFTESPDGKDTILRPHVQAIIFAMMPCGIREITKLNLQKAFLRLRMYEQGAGAMRTNNYDGVPSQHYITLAELHSMIGFTTNISTTTDAEFKTMLMRAMKDRATRAYQSQADTPFTYPN